MLILPLSSHYFSHMFHFFLLFWYSPYGEAQASLCLELRNLLHPLQSPQRQRANWSELILDSCSCVLQPALTGVPTHLPWALPNLTCPTVAQITTYPFLLLQRNLSRFRKGSAFVPPRRQYVWKLWALPARTVLLRWSQDMLTLLGGNSLAKQPVCQYPLGSRDWTAHRTENSLLFATAHQRCKFFGISKLLFSWAFGNRFFQYTRMSSRSSTPNICIISRSLMESHICSRRRAAFSPVTGDLEQHPGVQIQNRWARTPPVTAHLLRLHKVLLLQVWKVRPAALCILVALCRSGCLTPLPALAFAQHTNKCPCADMLIYRQDGDEEHLHLFLCERYPFWISFCMPRWTSNTGVIVLE